MPTKLLPLQILILILIFSCSLISAQIPKHVFNEITAEAYNPKNFTVSDASIKQRQGIYHFGESEGEWDFVIIAHNDSLIVQIWNGTWGTDQVTKKEAWLGLCRTFNNVKVEGNKIYFGKFTGLFTTYKENKKLTKALLLFSDPIGDRNYGKDSAEVGHLNNLSTIDNFYKLGGDKNYYKLSVKVQPESFFAGKTKQELKTMRNSIYARYGLIFQPGGEMETYFRKQDWYHAFKKDVSNCLTEIEKRNIETISRLEQM